MPAEDVDQPQHFLVELVLGKYPRVACTQSVEKTARRRKKGYDIFPNSQTESLQSHWLVVRANRPWSPGQRVRRYKLEQTKLVESSTSKARAFYDSLDGL